MARTRKTVELARLERGCKIKEGAVIMNFSEYLNSRSKMKMSEFLRDRAELMFKEQFPPPQIFELQDWAKIVQELEEENARLREQLEQIQIGATMMRDALDELLALKYHKDTKGKTPEYLGRQPKAWARAEVALKTARQVESHIERVNKLVKLVKQAMARFEREDNGNLSVRDGLTWAMYQDLDEGITALEGGKRDE